MLISARLCQNVVNLPYIQKLQIGQRKPDLERTKQK